MVQLNYSLIFTLLSVLLLKKFCWLLNAELWQPSSPRVAITFRTLNGFIFTVSSYTHYVRVSTALVS